MSKTREVCDSAHRRIRNPRSSRLVVCATVLLACALVTSIVRAQSDSSFYRPLTLEPADLASAEGGGAGDGASAQQGELARKSLNPVAEVTIVPLQISWDFGIGAESALRYTAYIQPVIPISLSEDWNAITRTIVPAS
jgi:hypothetical protein